MAAKRQNKTSTARFDAELLRKANIVAAIRGVSTTDYLSESLRPIIDGDFRREIEREAGEKRKP